MANKFSAALNLVLLGGVVLLWRHDESTGPNPQSGARAPQPEAEDSTARAIPVPAMAKTAPPPFRWGQLMPSNNYEGFIANLRASGCPEATVEDIVRGDIERAFSWERSQLGLDGSSGGPWSQDQENQLISSLLGNASPPIAITSAQRLKISAESANDGQDAQASASSEDAGTASRAYPLFLQNVNWAGMGFTPSQQAAIAQVRQEFQKQTANVAADPSQAASQTSDMASPNDPANPNLSVGGSTMPTPWQKAVQTANQQLQDALGNQAYAAYELQQYYEWYQPQVVAAASSGKPLVINPDEYHPTQ